MSGPRIEPAITLRTVAIIVVRLGEFPVDMEPILRLARQHGLFVVEDCAQAHGAQRAGRMVGTHGDIAAWSFCQDKIMTTACEGGAITTADGLSEGLRYLEALRLPDAPADVQPAFYRYHVDLRGDLLAPRWDRDRFVAALMAEGVPATHGGCFEIHRERAFRSAAIPPRILPTAAALSRTALALPVNHRMSSSDTDDVLVAVHKVMRAARR